MDALRTLFSQSSLYTWGILLILGVPATLLILGEWIERLQRRGSALAGPVINLRNLVLPLLCVRLVMEQLLGLDSSTLWVRLIETLVWLVALYNVLQFLTLLARSSNDPNSKEVQVPRVWSELLRMVSVLGVGFYVLGGLWGAPMDQVIAALGIGSIVIGFALQDTLSSLVAGLLIAFEKPFVVGHWLHYGRYEGQVIEMNWRSVRLRTVDRDVVIIPNSLLGKEVAVNFTMSDPLHAERLLVSFSYAHAPNEVKRMLMETVLATPGVIHQPPPHMRVIGYANDKFAINYEIKFFISDYARTEYIRDEVYSRVYYAAERAHINPPYATTILYQRNGAELERKDDFLLRVQQLRALPYLLNLADGEIEQLAAAATFYDFGADEWILQRGALFSGFYGILAGAVQLLVPVAGGDWQVIETLEAGQFVGELLLLRERPAPYAVVVSQDLRAIFIERTTFINVIENNPRLSLEMSQLIEERLRTRQRLIEQLATPTLLAVNAPFHPHSKL